MVRYANIISAVNGILEKTYPGIKRYGNDTVDQATPPYFFVEVVPFGTDYLSRNLMHRRCSVKITYNQRIPDQVDNLTKVEEIRQAVGMVFVPDCEPVRRLLVQDYTHEYIGNNDNILQISFTLDWHESTEVHEGDLIETIDTVIQEE